MFKVVLIKADIIYITGNNRLTLSQGKSTDMSSLRADNLKVIFDRDCVPSRLVEKPIPNNKLNVIFMKAGVVVASNNRLSSSHATKNTGIPSLKAENPIANNKLNQ